MIDHDALIERLSRDAQPVRRPAAPAWRAVLWSLAALPSGFFASLAVQRSAADWSQPGALWAALAIALAFAVGGLAIGSAFGYSIAGRRIPGWRWFAPLTTAWLLCVLASLGQASDPLSHADETPCFIFMLLAGAPMIVFAVLALRRTRSLYPRRSLALAGFGVAAMCQGLLGFCHPVAGNLPDLLTHLAAGATLVLATVLLGRRWVGLD